MTCTPDSMLNTVRDVCMEKYSSAPSTPAQVFKCISDSCVKMYCDSFTLLEQYSGRSFNGIHIMGGGSLDEYICKNTAKMLNREVLAGPYDATALGNIAVQMLAGGEFTGLKHMKAVVKNSCNYKRYLP